MPENVANPEPHNNIEIIWTVKSIWSVAIMRAGCLLTTSRWRTESSQAFLAPPAATDTLAACSRQEGALGCKLC